MLDSARSKEMLAQLRPAGTPLLVAVQQEEKQSEAADHHVDQPDRLLDQKCLLGLAHAFHSSPLIA
jgi:hypothetical protein